MSGSSPFPPVARAWKPSVARVVTLDGFLPVPRGAALPTVAPLSWPPKDPSDVLDYEVDATQALLGNDGDVITAISVLVQPPNELLPGQVFADGPVAVIWFSNGVAGTTYVVQVTLGTATGRVIGRAILMPVQALATATAPPATSGATAVLSLTTEAGIVVTDQNGAPIVVAG
jgi:hypothetical protein